MNKNFSGLTVILFFVHFACAQFTVNPNFYSHSYWYAHFNKNIPNYPTDLKPAVWTFLTDCNPSFLREGGHNNNFDVSPANLTYPLAGANQINPLDYVTITDNIRANGSEPMITVPFNATLTVNTNAANAAEVVRVLNVVHKRGVKYFIISNEPEEDFGIKGNIAAYLGNPAQYVSAYVKALSQAMKEIDPTVKIIGPELESGFATYALQNSLLSGTYSITGNIQPPSTAAGLPFIDYYSYHRYAGNGSPINNRTDYIEVGYTQVNNFSISLPASTGLVIDEYNLRLSTVPAHTVSAFSATDIAIDNEPNSNSFIGGQFIIDMIAGMIKANVAISNMWSSSEGSAHTFIHKDQFNNYLRKPSYWHYWLMAKYMRNEFSIPSAATNSLGAAITATTDPLRGVKAYACKTPNYIAVLAMNQSTNTATKSFSFSSGTTAPSSTADVNFALNLSGGSPALTGYSAVNTIDAKSTYLLFFDCSGVYQGRYELKESDMSNQLAAYDLNQHFMNATGTGTIAFPSTFNPLTASSTTACINTSGGALSASSGFSAYSWLSPDGSSYSGQTISGLSTPGLYTLSATGSCGVTLKTSAVVHLMSAIVDAGPDQLKCAPTVTIGNPFLPQTGQTYSWSASSGASPTGINPAVGPNNTTTYTLQASLAGSVCPISDVVKVDLFTAGTSHSLCSGQTVQLDAYSDATSFSWSPSTGLSATNLLNPYLTAINSGSTITTQIYSLTTTGGGCPGIYTVQMTFYPKPIITTTTPTVAICYGGSAGLTSLASGPGPFSYIWTPLITSGQGTGTITASPTVTTVYTEKVVGANSCVSYKTYTVIVNYLASNFTYPAQNLCSGSGSVAPVFVAGSTAGTFTSSSLNSAQLNPATGVVTPSLIPAGTFIITNSVSTCGGSSSTATINVFNDPLTANAGPDKLLYSNCRLILNGTYSPGTPTAAVSWLNQTGAVLTTNQSAVVYSPGSYFFTANDGTCTSVDEMKVNLYPYIACANKWNWPISTARIGCGGNNPIKTLSGVLSSSKIASNDTLWITGDVTVTNNKSLSIDKCLVIISPNVKINVQPGALLDIKGSLLQSCDGRTWQGIIVNGNNNVTNQLAVDASVLMDASTVVKADKAVGISLTDNLFYGGDVAVSYDRNKSFIIQKNEFDNYNTGIKTTNTRAGVSEISGNSFFAIKTGVSFDGDDHSKLILACNSFEVYKDYAVDSKNTILQDQGSTTTGAGNKFAGSNTATDMIRHTGNAMNYYYDPSSPVIATPNVNAQPALYDGSCAIVTARTINNSLAITTESASPNNETVITKEIEFKAFPNPFTNDLTVTYSLPAKCKSGELKIYDAAAGKLVYSTSLNSTDNKLKLELDVPQGLYFCSITAEDSSSKQFKLIHIK